MTENEKVAYFLEHLWTKGFKLDDEEVNFIFFGMKYTNTSAKQVIVAISLTLQVQIEFNRSYYVRLLELFHENNITSMEQGKQLINVNVSRD